MKKPEPIRPVELKRIGQSSPSFRHFLAVLRRRGDRAWHSPFAASGAKPPPQAPSKRRA